jgi:acyl-CoA reductase-like NAD-dependent aldehyde dehydrogenase
LVIPEQAANFVDGVEAAPASGDWLEKRRPADGSLLCRVARSGEADVRAAIAAAEKAQPSWAARTPVERGDLVREIALALRSRRLELSELVAAEGGKSLAGALAETDAAIEMGLFVAGEGRRSYGRTLPASMPGRKVMTVRRPVGLAALLISFNAPLPNVAWKAFPAIFCGNASVLKPSEETPLSALLFALICSECGLPAGVLNVVNGLGPEAGAALAAAPEIDLVSFTGSSVSGRLVATAAAARLAKTSLEMGGRNPLVVCDDAELESALQWALASAFSNAGQRCASAARIIVFESVYDEFRERLVRAAKELRVGVEDGDFLGPVISERALEGILAALEQAKAEGATVLAGGERLTDDAHASGYYLAPTVLEGVEPGSAAASAEIFGPVTMLFRARDLGQAIELANDSPYGLTAAIHTSSIHRALLFADEAEAGVVVVNGGTHGSEPHMGFGGVKQSGTGWREAGLEALDVFSEWKAVNLIGDPARA